MARRERPPDDLLGLGDVEAALRLGAPAQRDVGQRDVVADPVVAGSLVIVDGHQLSQDDLDDRDAAR